MPPRGDTRGARGGGPGRGSRGGASRGIPQATPTPSSHITTVGVKRPDFGTAGRLLPIFVNSFVTTIPEAIIHHYDGILSFSDVHTSLLIFLRLPFSR